MCIKGELTSLSAAMSSQDAKRLVLSEDVGDIFPSDSTVHVKDFIDLIDIHQRFNQIILTVFPFLSFLIPGYMAKLYYKKIPLSQNLKEHLCYIVSGASFTDPDPKPLTWERISKRFSRPIDIDHRKNADVRMGFRWRNVFFVKALFSTGTRHTESNEHHIIQTDRAPLIYYENRGDIPKHMRTFDFLTREHYRHFVLLPKKIYHIPPNTTYALITRQKAIFTIDRCREEFIRQLVQAKNITLCDPKLNNNTILMDIYEESPRTPCLTANHKWDPDESDRQVIYYASGPESEEAMTEVPIKTESEGGPSDRQVIYYAPGLEKSEEMPTESESSETMTEEQVDEMFKRFFNQTSQGAEFNINK